MAVHPSPDELTDFLLGKLPLDKCDEVAGHLEDCPPCQETIGRLESKSDTLLESVRDPVQAVPLDSACQRAMQKAMTFVGGSADAPSITESVASKSGEHDTQQGKAAMAKPDNSMPDFSVSAVSNDAPKIPTTAEIVANLKAANLFTEDDWNTIQPDIAAATDGMVLIKRLLEHGTLTKFQAQLVYQGKTRGLAFGEYIVLDRIGAGGMGQVFKARHRRMDRLVALKVMASAAMKDQEAVKRFQREAKAAARLIHPNIVTAFDAGDNGGVHFLVMEFVDGHDLSGYIKEHGPLPVPQAVDAILQAARGLAFAHAEGVVHRDIKPANLLRDKKGVVRVLDMGLARFDDPLGKGKDDGLTSSGAVMGTVDYMAPEQAFNTRDAGPAADVYSLGCTLYRLLTGQSLYNGETVVQKILAHREQAIPSLSSGSQTIPAALERLYERMVAKKLEDRPTMVEIVQELERIARGELSSKIVIDTQKAATAGRAASVRSASSGRSGNRPPVKWLVAAAGAAAILFFGVWVIIRDKDGNEVARVKAPDGSTVTMQSDAPATPLKTSTPPPVAPQTPAKSIASVPATPPSVASSKLSAPTTVVTPTAVANSITGAPSPLDALKREDISSEELKAAGFGDPSQAPPELVAVLGDSRWSHWNAIKRILYTRDGKQVVTASNDSTVKLWDAVSGRESLVMRHPDENSVVFCAAIHPKTRVVAAGYTQGIVRIWDLTTGLATTTINAHASADVYDLTFTPDGTTLITAAKDGLLKLWSYPEGKPLGILQGHSQAVQGIAISPDGKVIASASADKTVRLWNLEHRQSVATLDHEQSVRAVVFMDNQTLATGDNGKIQLWDVTSHERKSSFGNLPYSIQSLALSADGEYIIPAIGTSSGPELWEVATAPKKKQFLQFDGPVAFSPDGTTILMGNDGPSHANCLVPWDMATLQVKPGLSISFGRVTSLAMSPANDALAVTNNRGPMQLWDLATGRRQAFEFLGHSGVMSAVAFSPRDDLIATGSIDAFRGSTTLRLWNAKTGSVVATLGGEPSSVQCLGFNPSGELLAVGKHLPKGGSVVELWDVAQQRIVNTFTDASFRNRQLSFSPDGQTLATCDNSRTIQLWNVATAKVRTTIADKIVAGAVAQPLWSPDGNTIAAVNQHKVLFWNAAEGRRVNEIVAKGELQSIAYNSDGRVLAVASDDGTIRLYESATGKLLQTLTIGPNRGIVSKAIFDATDRYLITGNGNNTMYVLRLAQPPIATASRGLPAPSSVAEPNANITKAADGSFDLLKLLDLSRDTLAGDWKVDGGAIISSAQVDPEELNLLEVPTSLPREYQLTLVVRQAPGADKNKRRLAIGLPVAGQRVEAAIGIDGGKSAGLHLVEGVEVYDKKNPTRVQAQQPFVDGPKPQTIVCTVRPPRIEVSIDGKTIIDFAEPALLNGTRSTRLFDSLYLEAETAFRIDKLELLPVQTVDPWQPRINRQRQFLTSGLAAEPAKLSGIGRWQVETVGTRSNLNCVAISPDGKQVACGNDHGQIRIYDPDTWRLIRCWSAHPVRKVDAVKSLAWSPDGTQVASTGSDGLRLWKTDGTLMTIRSLDSKADVRDSHVCWSPDSSRLAVGTSMIRIFDRDGSVGPSFKLINGGSIYDMCFSPDGRQLVYAAGNQKASIINLDGSPGPELVGQESEVTGISWSKLGQIATVNRDKTLRIWDASGKPGLVVRDVLGNLTHVRWSPEGTRLLAGNSTSFNASLFVLSPEGEVLTQEAHGGQNLGGITWSADGQRIAYVANVHPGIWDLKGKAWSMPEYRANPHTLAWSPDAHRLAMSTTNGRKFRILKDDGTVESTYRGIKDFIRFFSWSPDGKRLAIPADENAIRLYEVGDKALTENAKLLQGHSSGVVGLQWSPDGQYLASRALDKTIRLWNTGLTPGLSLKAETDRGALAWLTADTLIVGDTDSNKQRILQQWKIDGTKGPSWPVSVSPDHVAVSPDGTRLLVNGGNSGLIELDPVGKELFKIGGQTGLGSWSKDGKQWSLRTNQSHGSALRVIDTATHKPSHVLPTINPQVSDLSSTGVLAVCSDYTVQAWDSATGRPLWTTACLNDDQSVTLAADGRVLQSGDVKLDDVLFYSVERDDGRVDTLTYSEFIKLAPEYVQPLKP